MTEQELKDLASKKFDPAIRDLFPDIDNDLVRKHELSKAFSAGFLSGYGERAKVPAVAEDDGI